MFTYMCIYVYVCVYVHMYVYEYICICILKKLKSVGAAVVSPPHLCVHVCMYYKYDMNEYIRQAKPSSSHVSSAPAAHTPMRHPTTSQTQQVSCAVI